MIDEARAREILENDGTLVDIGQLTKDAKRMLARNFRAGKIVKWRAPWRGMGPLKTHYRM